MSYDVLQKVDLFGGLDETELTAIAAHAATRTFPKNAILVIEGDLSDSLYVVRSGRVKVYTSDNNGREALLNYLGPGEYFGELSLLDEEPRSASVMAVEPSQMLIIARTDFTACLQDHVSIAIDLLKVLVRRQRDLIASTKSLALMGVYERVVAALEELAIEQDGELIVSGISHQALADQVYASREMITLILKELKQGGYIDTSRKTIAIKKRLPAKW